MPGTPVHGLDIRHRRARCPPTGCACLITRCHDAQLRAYAVSGTSAVPEAVAELRGLRDALEAVEPVTDIGHVRLRYLKARIWRALETLGGNPV